MKFRIHYDGKYADSIVIEGNSIKEIKEKADIETNKRNWDIKNCWSEEIK